MLAGLEGQEVGALGGAVELGGPPTTVNRAAFLSEYGEFIPPLAGGPTDGALPGNNLACRRAVLLEWCGDILAREGFNKPFCQDRIRERGGTLVMRPAMRVRHLSAHRFVPFAVRRFHYARRFGATRLRLSPPRRRLLYRVFAPAVPPLLMWQRITRARRRPSNRPLLRGAIPALIAICAVWGVGEWLGYWFGPGRSCDKYY